MSDHTTRQLFWVPVFAAVVGTAGLTVFHSAQASDTVLQAGRAQYEAQRQVCMNGQSGQDTTTCLKEAAAALAEAQKGALGATESQDALVKNALARCERVATEDKAACRSMALGGGAQSGTVKGGGVIKEYREVIVPPADSVPTP